MKPDHMASSNRPLSPHLQIWRWQITMSVSMLHRGSGVILGFGAVILTYWLIALAAGPDAYGTAQMLIGSWLGRLILFGLTASLVAHFINGVRHLLLNAGMGFPLPTVRATGWMVMAATPIVTVLIWIAGYAVRGSL